MALQGSLKTMSVSDVLQFLAVGRKTGLLKISHGKVLKGIYFEEGIIIGSSTNDPKEYFGQVLIHYGKIDEAQLQAAMEVQRQAAVQSPTSKVQRPVSAASSGVQDPGQGGAPARQDAPIGDLRSQISENTTATSAEADAAGGLAAPIGDLRSQISEKSEISENATVGTAIEDLKFEISEKGASPLQLSAGEVEEQPAKWKPAASNANVKAGGRLGQVLVAQGVLTDAEVRQVLEIRTLDIIYDLFIWKEGLFEFVSEDALPPDFTRVHVDCTRVIMDGIYRADELARYRTLIPSDRALLELRAGWTSSLETGKATRQLLYFLEKRMSVAEICYNMHSSAFEVYGQLYDLVKNGLAHVVGELPEIPDPVAEIPNLPEDTSDLLLLARGELDSDEAEKALSIIHTVLRREPKDTAAQNLLEEAEKKFISQLYSRISPTGVPKIVIQPDELAQKEIGPQEGFMLSRINGEWDLQSILSICPFREADSLLMIKKLWDGGIIGF